MLIGLGLIGLLSVFDVLANAQSVTRYADNTFEVLWTYILLKIPHLENLSITLACFLAATGTLAQKVTSHELIAMRSLGLSSYKILTMLMIFTSLIAIFYFVLNNFILPVSAHKLHLWSEMDYRGSPPDRRMTDQIPNWVAANNTIINLQSASDDGRTLHGLSVITRSDTGLMKDYFIAQTAYYDKGVWYLENVSYPNSFSRDLITEKVILDLPLKPGFFAKTVDLADALSIFDLWRIVQEDIVLERPTYIYHLWLHQKFAHPFNLLVMVIIAMPLAVQLARRQSMLIASFFIILGGFLFLISQSLTSSLGEGGYLPPFLAAWSPGLIFSLMAFWAVLIHEK